MTRTFTITELATRIGGSVAGVPPSDQDSDVIISGNLVIDSRQAKPGDLFVAIPGVKVDGAEFVPQAFLQGARAAVVRNAAVLNGHPGIVVENPSAALSRLAALWSDFPAEQLTQVGVTGTNGKTTTNWLVFHALNLLGIPTFRCGTLGAATVSNELIPETLTTPDALALHRLCARARSLGCQAGVFEVSSHALTQHRADDLQFDVGIFTNLTRDHLDYHLTMESYLAAKARLFELMVRGKKCTRAAIFNIDDSSGAALAQRFSQDLKVCTFGRSPAASLRIGAFQQSFSGGTLKLLYGTGEMEIASPFIGDHNAENIAGAVAALLALGHSPQVIAEIFPKIPAVPGRLEPVPHPNRGVFVDYAHTPDALVRALAALRPLTTKKLHVLFGCGGDRDRGKRPQMLRAALAGADVVTVTSDNPRTEDPERIIGDILAGNTPPNLVEIDRRRAIQKALGATSAGDVILVAGKGHETYQIVGSTKHHFSDVEECRAALQEIS